jgi:hypothetical protein
MYRPYPKNLINSKQWKVTTQRFKEIVEESWDEFGIMDEVDNCYPAIVEPVVTETTHSSSEYVPVQD